VNSELSAEAYILDSFALMDYLENEVSGEQVTRILRKATAGEIHAYFSLINYGECLYIIEREQGLTKAQEMIAVVDQLPIEVVPVDRLRIFAAAHIKAHYSLSYADAFVVALAQEFNATVITGDPEFRQVENSVSILWLPQS
jgi:predicted nucleic acid-binding protein